MGGSVKKRARQTETAHLSATAMCIGCTTVSSALVILLLDAVFKSNCLVF
jgi:hypothetical protein